MVVTADTPNTSTLSMREFRARNREKGLKEREVWIHPSNSKSLRRIEKILQRPNISTIQLSREIMNNQEAWNIAQLADAIGLSKDIEVKLLVGTSSTLLLTMAEYGDLQMHMAVAGDQIIVQSDLFPASAVKSEIEFNEAVLKSRDMFQLSCIALEPGADDKFKYVMYGALSSSSTAQSVITEIETLASNVLRAAEAFEDFLL